MSVTFENDNVFNLDGAMRAMRNPMNSWNKSDSFLCDDDSCYIGRADIELACKLIAGGSEHRKFLRQIFVCVDITAPRYWWQEFDTYKVGTVRNSCSTMHKLTSRPLENYDFEVPIPRPWLDYLNDMMEFVTQGTTQLYCLKAHLPEGFMQTATITMNYEVVRTMYQQRKNHRLPHWHKDFVEWVRTLPYAPQFITDEMCQFCAEAHEGVCAPGGECGTYGSCNHFSPR
jgi:hypothetical protein